MNQAKRVASGIVLTILLSSFSYITGISTAANAAVLVNVTAPMIDPNTSLLVSAGLIGDKMQFTSVSAITSPVVTFTGSVTANATLVVGTTYTYSVTVPQGAQTGPVTVNGTSLGNFQVWASRGEPYVMPNGHLNITYNDLQFILDQIKMSEAHAARTKTTLSAFSVGTPTSSVIYPYDVTSSTRCLTAGDLASATTSAFGTTGLSNAYMYTAEDPIGLRQVDGQCNNIANVQAEANPAVPASSGDTAGWGAADQMFTRLSPRATGSTNPSRAAYDAATSSVNDPTPREISNLISDQTSNNPAALAAAINAVKTLYGANGASTETSINATNGNPSTVYQIPNITADYNVSAGYNSWFTLFGQFFDHGLDLIPKAGPQVVIPLQQDDPLYVNGSHTNMMMLSRGADSNGDAVNGPTPWIDQSQTYGSHPSQNFFLREYVPSTLPNKPFIPTGYMLDENGQAGIPTWKTVKAQARMLGIILTDYDADSIPVIATDQYGNFIPGAHGYPMMLFKQTDAANYQWIEASAGGLGTGRVGTPLTISGTTWSAVGSGHPFINDTTASAVPYPSPQCGLPAGSILNPDNDLIINSAAAAPSCSTYDNETLDMHLIAGDGRINENIGLSAVHNVFHEEHNLLINDIQNLLVNDPIVPSAFVNEWKIGSDWNGNRLFQAARFIMEMEYQHMVYDEFVRRIAPELPVFITYNPNVNPAITQEFASAVYRLGHSMLNETIARSNPGSVYDPTNNQDVPLITAFTNPAQTKLVRPAVIASATSNGSSITYTMSGSGEAPPKATEVVTISNMVDAAFNIQDAVVASVTSTTFTISKKYSSGSLANISAPSNGSSSVSKQDANNANYALVTVSDPGTAGYDYTYMEAAASIAQGMSSQRGNEIDEFVTDAVRNNLLGLPLDLASLNIARGRDVGLPSFNDFRRLNSAKLPPYISWDAYITNGLRHPESGVNFLAAYGQFPTILAATTLADKRAAAATVLSNGATSGTPEYDFLNSTGTWAGIETGLNYIDLWIGGLAEKPNSQPILAPMLGSTFQYVFDDQMQKLQDNDRFYYLSRLLGTNLFGEIPAQKFTDIVRRNTPSAFSVNNVVNRGILGMNTPGFGIADCAANSGTNVVSSALLCSSASIKANGALQNLGLSNVILFPNPSQTSGTKLTGGDGDDSIQGSPYNDVLNGGLGGDVIVGGAGNDIINGGPGEDVINGGPGDDSINTGSSQIGDIADGSSGNDFIQCGLCAGIAISFNGEAGNDFIQGSAGSDLAITGGEGDDWLEGGPGLDIMNGDNGPLGNVRTGLPTYFGGNDVLNPGAGLDTPFGDGGDDIFLLGQGTAFPDGAYGFDWADYEYATRFDNSSSGRPNIWADLGGTFNPNTARTNDLLLNIEGLSGSAGDDKLFGGIGRTPLAVARATGTAGSIMLTLPGAVNVLPGSRISGAGIAPNTIVNDLPPPQVVGGNTIIYLSLALTANVNGSIQISTDPLNVPSLVDGLPALVSNTPGWTRNGGTAWSGGALIFGGEGNDTIYPSDGADVIHGSAYLHTCIYVANLSGAALQAADVPCGGVRGFSNMSLLAPFVDSGAVSPSSLKIVREILPSSVLITSVNSDGTNVTYTANNSFHVGEVISILGLVSGSTNLVAYMPRTATITAATSTSFTIALTSTAGTFATTAGFATATDTLDLSGAVTTTGGLSGPSTQFTFTKINGTLPAGASFGCTITDRTSGNVLTVYDVELIKFSTGAVQPISNNCGAPGVNGVTQTTPRLTWTPRTISKSSGATWTITAPTVTGAVAGTFSYAVTSETPVGTVTLTGANGETATASSTAAGTATITATFTPTDAVTYTNATINQTVNVAAPGVTPPPPTGAITITLSPTLGAGSNYTVLSKVTLGETGVIGSVTYTAAETNCRILGTSLSVSSAGTCTVTATSVATPSITGTISIPFVLANQASFRISNKVVTASQGSSFRVITSGGSGSGAITFTVTKTGNGAGTCTINATTGSLTNSGGAATCAVTATKAGNALYNSTISAPVTFTYQ